MGIRFSVDTAEVGVAGLAGLRTDRDQLHPVEMVAPMRAKALLQQLG